MKRLFGFLITCSFFAVFSFNICIADDTNTVESYKESSGNARLSEVLLNPKTWTNTSVYGGLFQGQGDSDALNQGMQVGIKFLSDHSSLTRGINKLQVGFDVSYMLALGEDSSDEVSRGTHHTSTGSNGVVIYDYYDAGTDYKLTKDYTFTAFSLVPTARYVISEGNKSKLMYFVEAGLGITMTTFESDAEIEVSDDARQADDIDDEDIAEGESIFSNSDTSTEMLYNFGAGLVYGKYEFIAKYTTIDDFDSINANFSYRF